MDENERNLFAEHLQATDKVIQPGITRFKWSSKSNVDSFLGRTCRGVCNDLYHKLKEFKSNTEGSVRIFDISGKVVFSSTINSINQTLKINQVISIIN